MSEENNLEKRMVGESPRTNHGKYASKRYRWWSGTAFPVDENITVDKLFKPIIKGLWYKVYWEYGEESGKIHCHFLVYSANQITKGNVLCEDERLKAFRWNGVETSLVSVVSNYEFYKIVDGKRVEKRHISTFVSDTKPPSIITSEMKWRVQKEIVAGNLTVLNGLTSDEKASLGDYNLEKWNVARRFFLNAQIDLSEERESCIEIRYGKSRAGKSWEFQTDEKVCVMDETSLREGGDLWYDSVLDHDNPKTIVLNEFSPKKLKITNALSLVDNTAVVRPVKGGRVKVDCRKLVYIANDEITDFFDYLNEAAKTDAFSRRIKSVKYFYKEWTKEDPETYVEVDDLYRKFLTGVHELSKKTSKVGIDVEIIKLADRYKIEVQKRVETAKTHKKMFGKYTGETIDLDKKDENLNEIGSLYGNKLCDKYNIFSKN